MPSVDYDDLETAFMFVSGGELIDASARISRKTGEIFWISEELLDEEPLPDDIDDEERYVEIPTKHDLDLGQRLVLRFVYERFSDHYEDVRAIFRKKGAYWRFKSLLERHDMLDEWYQYENSAVREALCEWARNEGFDVREVPPAPAGGHCAAIEAGYGVGGLRALQTWHHDCRGFSATARSERTRASDAAPAFGHRRPFAQPGCALAGHQQR